MIDLRRGPLVEGPEIDGADVWCLRCAPAEILNGIDFLGCEAGTLGALLRAGQEANPTPNQTVIRALAGRIFDGLVEKAAAYRLHEAVSLNEVNWERVAEIVAEAVAPEIGAVLWALARDTEALAQRSEDLRRRLESVGATEYAAAFERRVAALEKVVIDKLEDHRQRLEFIAAAELTHERRLAALQQSLREKLL